MRVLFPTRALALLLGIGLLDLIATLALHHHGMIEERNPLMATALAHGPLHFAAAKGFSLLVGWIVLARAEVRVVRRACLVGSILYVAALGVSLLGPR